MKRFIKLMGIVLVLGSVATASSTVEGNPEVSLNRVNLENPTTVKDGGDYCDPLEQLMGICKNSENILSES